MRDTRRRQRLCLWSARWLLPLGLGLLASAACPQGQHDAAVEAMAPPTLTGLVLTNRIVPPDFLGQPASRDKQRLRATVVAAATPPPTGPTAPALAPVPGPDPNPLQPPPAPATTRDKPLPLENPEQVRLQADDVHYADGETEGRGNLQVRYQEITIRSFVGRLDKGRVWGTFSGDVDMQAKLYDLKADELRLNLETEEFSARQAAATVDPEYFQGQVLAPIYVHAAEVVGRPDRVVATEGAGSSCDLWPDPHWALRSNRITVVPDRRVIFHKPTLYLFGHRLFRYPWDLQLSLRRRDNRFIPEIGQNAVEGYYAKFAYGYSLNDENYGVIRLHLTEKRGVGVGFDHTLDAGKQYAQLSVFTEPEQGSFTGRLLHRGQYGAPLTSNLTMSFQQNSGYGYASESLSGDLTLRYDTREAHTALGLQHSLLDSGVSTSRRSASTLTHRQQTGGAGEWTVRANYQTSSYLVTQAADQELQTEFTWRRDFRLFAANLAAGRRFDIDAGRYTGDSNFFSLNRLPDLTLTTDSARLGNYRFLGNRFDATVYLGYFDQQPDDIQSYRTGLEFRLPGMTREFGKIASLRTSARFRQMFYTGAAQWVFDAQTEYRLQLPGFWQTRFTFNYSHPEGVSPIRTDYASPTAVLYFEAVRLVADRMRLNLTCGRDFQNSYYQDAIMRGELLLSPRNRLELQSGYSIENSRFRPLNLRWVFATRRSWWSAVTINYDLDQTDLTNLSLDVDWNPSDLWRIQFLGGYSGYGGLDQADIRVTRDLHCMLAQMSYSKATQEFRIGLGIKAFPSNTRTFGVGQRGQYFESNFGDTY